jgi:hypothetical protein
VGSPSALAVMQDPGARFGRGKERMFFFEKKNQKTFVQ